uniref:Vomeronasal type-1 receptor n=1 Tax=Plectus sambesii TaxID=2011161 RepID=A0A914XBX8_9BILA
MFASAAGRLTVVNVNKQDDQVLHMAGNLTHFGMSIMMMIAVCAITAYFPTKNYLPTLRKVICVFMIAFFSWYLMHLYFLSKYPIPAQERTPFTTWIGRLHIDPNTPPFSKTVIYMLAIGAFCQWSMIVCEGTFILTYLAEFSSVVVHLAFENRKGIKANKWQQPIKPSVISVGH